MAVQGAINSLKSALAPNSKLAKAAYKRELRRKHHLQFRLAQLAPLGKLLPLSKPLKQMSLTELQDLATKKADDPASFQVLNLDAMRKNMCRTCREALKKRKHIWQGKFPDTERGGTAIPFIPGLFVCGKVSMKQLLRHKIFWIRDGTTLGTVGNPDTGTPEIAIFVHMHTLAEIDSKKNLWQELAELLHKGAVNGAVCKTNGAHKAVGCPGMMVVLGWRKNVFDPTPFDIYAPPPAVQKDPKLFEAWKEHVRNITRIWFTLLLARTIAHQAQEFVRGNKLPAFGDYEPDVENHGLSLGSNFTISFLGFFNQAHLDKDGSIFVFSIYIFVDIATGQLVTDRSRIQECMEGGQFLWPDIHGGVDPSQSNRVVIFFWRGTHKRHCTIESKAYEEDTGVRRYGTSLQVNKTLLSETLKYHQAMAEYKVEQEEYEASGCEGKVPEEPVQPGGLGGWLY
ncbi:hypothetical protein FRC07_003951 [Ceratobasidium sp. 392]|nr:hypothetical protein FRC07_003951 [Ceratobasidium sp. 392]